MQKNDKRYSDLDFQGYKAIAMACDSGATLPAAPSEGLWFLHTPTGRNVLMQYVGGTWNPIFGFGALTLYVDVSLGSDAADNGFGTGADAFQTFMYAYDSIPSSYSGSCTINLAAGTYAEQISLVSPAHPVKYGGAISVNGELLTHDTGTVTSSVAGSGATRTSITDTSKSWVVDEHKGKLCLMGTGLIRLIISNTVDTLIISRPAGASVGSSYTIYDYGTVFNTGISATHFISVVGAVLNWNYIQFRGLAGNALMGFNSGSASLVGVAIEPDLNVTNSTTAFNQGASTSVNFTDCYVTTINRSLSVSPLTTFTGAGCYFLEKTKAKTQLGLQAAGSGGVICNVSCTFEGWGSAVRASGLTQFGTTAGLGYHFFVDNDIAIDVVTGGIFTRLSALDLPQFSGNRLNYQTAWQLGETTFSKVSPANIPALTVVQGTKMQDIQAQTAAIGEVKADVRGSGERIYGVVHTAEGIESPGNPCLGDIWIDTN